MSKFIIEGGRRLKGTIRASGNKNAALKLLPACLLTDAPIILHNVPNIEDVRNTLLILQDLGVDVQDLGSGTWRIQASRVDKWILDSHLAGRTRASFVFSGPMVARMGRVTLPLPGGDVIGGRPLDTHIGGLRALGVEIDQARQGVFQMEAPKLRGAGYLLLAEASVTATENTVMAAVLAKGETIIDNAASEPHVRDLCRFLNMLGANIEGIGTNRLVVEGHGGLAVTVIWLVAFALIWLLPGMYMTLFGADHLSPGKVAIFLMVEVVMALVSSAILIDEPFGWREAAGAALILGASLVEFGGKREVSW